MLSVFIVLRDKDLRARMSSFLSGARRKMVRIRLQAKVRKEEAKRIALLRSLGEKAWDLDLPGEKAEPVRASLKEIGEKIHLEQIRWHGLITEIEGLNGRLREVRREFEKSLHRLEEGRKPHLDELRGLLNRKEALMESFSRTQEELEAARNEAGSLEREVDAVQSNPAMPDGEKAARIEKIREASASLRKWIGETQERISLLEEEQGRIEEARQSIQSRIDLINEDIRRLDSDYRAETRTLEEETRGRETEKRRTEKGLIALKESTLPLFESLGRAFEESRLKNPDLEILYLEIDGVDGTIRDLKSRIDKLA